MNTSVGLLPQRDPIVLRWRWDVAAVCAVTALAWLATMRSGPFAGRDFGMANMPGMTHEMGPITSSGLGSRLVEWLLMCIAMMCIGALPMIRWVHRNTLRRRWHALPTVLCTYLAVWAAVGVLAVLALERSGASRTALCLILLAAAVWQLTPMKRWATAACDRPSPLRLRGIKAVRSEIRFGVLQASACVASCWLLMLPMAFPGHPPFVVMAAGSTAVTTERWHRRPRRGRRVGALVLAGVAGLVAVG
jgi:predicted metal-binding membrane protein